LPAIFACGAINGLIIVGEGHALNAPDVPVARSAGLLQTLAMVVAAILTALTNRRPFTFVERLSFIGIFVCFALLFSSFEVQTLAMIGALCCACIPLAGSFVTRKSEQVHLDRGPRG
jgi:hypothetical protein